MAIDTLDRATRQAVAWFGATPPADGSDAFVGRGFEVRSYSDADLDIVANLAGLAAVVFTQNAEKPLEITRSVERHALRLLNYDCRVILRPAPGFVSVLTTTINKIHLPTASLPPKEAEKLQAWQPLGRGDPPLPHARVFEESVPWADVANFVVKHPSGLAPNHALVIEPEAIRQLIERASPDCALLVRRAFADCAEIYLEPMDGGRSGIPVYRAYATLSANFIGRWPNPYFVKLGNREKVFAEFQNYRDRVDPYVPFYLGPHLIRERCCLGATDGLIVGDYVEESESLVDCARDGRAGRAIACLFDRTLRGWYRSARTDREESSPIGKSLLRRFPRKLPAARIERARTFGATLDLSALRALFARCTSTPLLVGPIHGDLHASNVRVRASDAIVIDFFAHDVGPLVCDAACLEASLLVDGFREKNAYASSETERLESDIRTWLASIEALYDHVPLKETPAPPDPQNPSCWFHGCVRQIRLYAREMELGEHQYAAALALALLIKASKDRDAAEPEASRRAVAYLLAERVLSQTFGSVAAVAIA